MLQRVIVEVKANKKFKGFYSNLFTVQKPDRDVRPILDLKALNQFRLILLH